MEKLKMEQQWVMGDVRKENPIVNDIYNRLNYNNRNCLAVFVGKVGTGKSLGASTFNMWCDPTYWLNRCFFTTESFYDMLTSEKFNKANALLWEEMGVSADKRSFMTVQNKVLTYTFQTWRSKSLLLTMTVPSIGFIDSRIHHMIDFIFESQKAYRDDNGMLKGTVVRCYNVQHNPLYGKSYTKYPIYTRDGKPVKVKTMYIPAPPEDYIKEYKIMKEAFNLKLNKDTQTTLINKAEDKRRDKEPKPQIDIEGYAQQVAANPEEYKGKGVLVVQAKVENKFKIGSTYASRIANRARQLIEDASK